MAPNQDFILKFISKIKQYRHNIAADLILEIAGSARNNFGNLIIVVVKDYH
jgi:hypothetical protein